MFSISAHHNANLGLAPDATNWLAVFVVLMIVVSFAINIYNNYVEKQERKKDLDLRTYEAHIKSVQADTARVAKGLPSVPLAVEAVVHKRVQLDDLSGLLAASASPSQASAVVPSPAAPVVAATSPVVPTTAPVAPQVPVMDFSVSAADEQIVVCLGYGSTLQIGRHGDLGIVVATLLHDGWTRELKRLHLAQDVCIPDQFVSEMELLATDVLTDIAVGSTKSRKRGLKRAA